MKLFARCGLCVNVVDGDSSGAIRLRFKFTAKSLNVICTTTSLLFCSNYMYAAAEEMDVAFVA